MSTAKLEPFVIKKVEIIEQIESLKEKQRSMSLAILKATSQLRETKKMLEDKKTLTGFFLNIAIIRIERVAKDLIYEAKF